MARACGNLGVCYESTGEHARAIALHADYKAMAEELGDRAGVGMACNTLGASHSKRRATYPPPRAPSPSPPLHAPSCRASPRCSVWSVTWARTTTAALSLFEDQQTTCMLLQSVLLAAPAADVARYVS